MPKQKTAPAEILYPFHKKFPLKVFSWYRWHKNTKIKSILPKLNKNGKWITIIDRLGGLGDTIITANIIYEIKKKFKNLKINCITPNPELIIYDPIIDKINGYENFYSIDSCYTEVFENNKSNNKIIDYTLDKIGIKDGKYKARFHTRRVELEWAKKELIHLKKPLIGISTRTKEDVKNWPEQYWDMFIQKNFDSCSFIQLGDENEIIISNATRFAGKLNLRQSAAILSQMDFYIGSDSLLMHLANAFKIKSIIIFGGSRNANQIGYENNINITNVPNCSPCWIHKEDGEFCNYKIKCMSNIKPAEVDKIFKRNVKEISDTKN